MKAPYKTQDDDMVPKGVVEQAKVLVNKHAAQAHEMLEGIENNIAGIGRQLDELRAARDILTGALQGTEKLRAELRDDGSASAPESDPFE